MQEKCRKCTLLTFDPFATFFCRNNEIWLQEVVVLQRFLLLIAIDWIFATCIISWL